ncbi:MAG TPA: DoxX family protein [Ohtaekwangia sp.]|uniref:DoxX family protein n=1 Tax=Ohtaekwangia sp. TaxID=2066019 RepID=UPI002F936A4F
MALLNKLVVPTEGTHNEHSVKDVLGTSRESQVFTPEWKNYEKILFRFFFIYFSLQVIPLDWKYYRDLISLDWFSLHFGNFFYLAHYTPRFFSNVPVFEDWLVTGAIAIAGAIVWGLADQRRREYNKLYYWLRVALRYRLAAALLAYGFIKFFPMQMPLPSLSNLNTHYGDIADWKVFSMSTGIVPGYESFLGLVEISAALLLLYRKTASIGAFIIIPFTGNVILSNLAYEGGEYVYGSLLASFAIFLLAYDVPRLISLTSQEKITSPPRFKPSFADDSIRNARIILKSVFVFVFVVLYAFRTYASYSEDIYQYPNSKGLAGASGIYTVTQFSINGKELPPSATDPLRWKDVVFEKWATLSIRSNSPVVPQIATTEEIFTDNDDRIYEFSGTTSRHYYTYRIDSAQHVLTLKNRNSHHAADQFTLKYERPANDQIVLSGINAQNDSLRVVLHRIDKKYLLQEAAKQGRRRGLKL